MLVKVNASCIYCMVAHAVGLVIAALLFCEGVTGELNQVLPEGKARRRWTRVVGAVLVGGAVVVVVAGGQVLWPTPTYRVMNASGSTLQPTHIHVSTPVQGKDPSPPYDTGDGPSRRISLPLSKGSFLTADVPIMGAPDAPHMLVYFADYTCAHCQDLHSHLEMLLHRFGDQLAIARIDVSSYGTCAVSQERPMLTEKALLACQYMRLGLAVFRCSLAAFQEWDRWVSAYGATPPLSASLNKAIDLVGREALEHHLADPWIEQRIALNRKLHEAVPERQLPVLVLEHQYISGAPHTAEPLIRIIKERLGLEPVIGAH